MPREPTSGSPRMVRRLRSSTSRRPDHPGHPHDDRAGCRSQRQHGARGRQRHGATEPDRIAQAGRRFVHDEAARGLAGGGCGLQLAGRAALRVHDGPRSGPRRREPAETGGSDPVLRCRGRSAEPARRADRPPGFAGVDRWRRYGQRVGQSGHGDRCCAAAGSAGLHTRTGQRGRNRQRCPPPAGRIDPREYYAARDASQLKAIYETIAARIGASYTLVYESDRRLPDGTLRPVRIFHRGSRQAGETAVFIPGMVVPAAGWSPLFLAPLTLLGTLALVPSWLKRRRPA